MKELMHVHVHVCLLKQLRTKKENFKRMANIIQFRNSTIMITKSNVCSSFQFIHILSEIGMQSRNRTENVCVQKVMQQHAVAQAHTHTHAHDCWERSAIHLFRYFEQTLESTHTWVLGVRFVVQCNLMCMYLVVCMCCVYARDAVYAFILFGLHIYQL